MKIFALVLFVFIVSGCRDPEPEPTIDPNPSKKKISKQCSFKITIPEEKITFTCQCVRYKWEETQSLSPIKMASCTHTPQCPKKSAYETCEGYRYRVLCEKRGLKHPMRENELSEVCINGGHVTADENDHIDLQ